MLLSILAQFKTNYQTIDMFTLNFITGKGVEKVCQLHMALLRFEQDGSLKPCNNLTKCIFYKQVK